MPQQGDFGLPDAEIERYPAEGVADAPNDLKNFPLLNQAEYYSEDTRRFTYGLGRAWMYYLLSARCARARRQGICRTARTLSGSPALHSQRQTGNRRSAEAELRSGGRLPHDGFFSFSGFPFCTSRKKKIPKPEQV